MANNPKDEQHQTTGQQLGSIKSARGIVRKDKGFSADLDRLAMFTWIMFLARRRYAIQGGTPVSQLAMQLRRQPGAIRSRLAKSGLTNDFS